MKFRNICLLGIVLLFLLSMVGAHAHVPLTTGDNEALETATHIHDPLKSWAIYSELREGGVANYYRFDMDQGQRLRLLLFIPKEDLFTPGLVIMGPGIESQGTIPAFIDVPEGSGALVVEGKRPNQASYEPFTPASQYNLVDVDMEITAPGTYYVAVYEPSQGGLYGLALGYQEEFGLVECIRVPLDVIRVHLWEGQPLGFILAPLLGIVVIGYIFLLWQRKKGALVLQNSFGMIGSFVGFPLFWQQRHHTHADGHSFKQSASDIISNGHHCIRTASSYSRNCSVTGSHVGSKCDKDQSAGKDGFSRHCGLVRLGGFSNRPGSGYRSESSTCFYKMKIRARIDFQLAITIALPIFRALMNFLANVLGIKEVEKTAYE